MNPQISRRNLLGYTIIIVMVATWAMFHVWTRNSATEIGYSISKQQAVSDQLLCDNAALKIELSTLKSTKRLELLAHKELGLSVPKPEQVVYVWKKD